MEINWCGKQSSLFFLMQMAQMSVQSGVWDMFALGWLWIPLTDMSLDTENRLSKVVSKWGLYSMCPPDQLCVLLFVFFFFFFLMPRCCTQITLVLPYCCELSTWLASYWVCGNPGTATAGLCCLPFAQLNTGAVTIGKLLPQTVIWSGVEGQAWSSP